MMGVDIAVIGAGPAGVVTAIVLVRRGYRVVLCHRPRSYPALEGLAERALTGLRHAGCEHAIASLSQQAARQAYWNGQSFTGNLEWLADRELFDQALLQDTRAAGVAVLDVPLARFEYGSLLLSDGQTVRADFIIDARGRAAPQNSAQLISGPAMTALSQRWRISDKTSAQTLISPFADGWAWLAISDQGWGLLQVFVNTERQKLPPRAKLADFYHSTLADLPFTRQWLDGATPEGPIHARFSQPQYSRTVIAERYLRVGDTAFAIDPLSGHGVYFAISGALTAAAVVHTILSKPENSAVAEQFYRERIEDDFWRMARIGRDFYQQEQRWPEALFWRERQRWPDQQPAHAAPDSFRPRIEKRPVNINGVIELREVIVSADHPRGVWQVAGVELASLLRRLQGGGQVDDPAEKIAQAWLAVRGLL